MAFYATFLPSRETSRALGQTNATADLTYSGVAGVQSPQTLSFTVASRSTAQLLPDPFTLTLPAPAVQGESAGLLAPDDPGLRVAAAGTSAAGGGASGPGSTAFPACDTSQSPIYCVYTVEKGDTLGGIAAKFGLKATGELAAYDFLVQSNKPDITNGDDFIQPGQKLRIPTQNGLVHTVRSNDTLIDIASTYDVTPASIVAVLGNGITNLDSLKVGQEVLVPDPKRLAKPAPAVSSAASSSASSPQIIRGSQVSKSGFIWPVTGPISSYFGPSHPLGIDIDLYASPNAPIASVASGTVTFAGGNTCCSYGLYVVVAHGNGFETVYAHLSKISVSAGQKVQQGQVLGNGGRSGYATGNHLHFEVHLSSGAIVNPLSYLP